MPLGQLLSELTTLRAQALAREEQHAAMLARVHPEHRASAANLLHYLALRQHELRPLQQRLTEIGLSSLGRSEAHVLATLDAVISALRALAGLPPRTEAQPKLSFAQGRALLLHNAESLLGPLPEHRDVRILVTAPGDHADPVNLTRQLLAHGMDALRINCAHDDRDTWTRLITGLRTACAESGRGCTVLMDLAGHKLRTGPVAAGPQVCKVRPDRDPMGRLVAPARVFLTPEEAPEPPSAPAAAVLPVAGAWLQRLAPGRVIEIVDTRDKRRRLDVCAREGRSVWADCAQTTYFATGCMLEVLDEHWGGDGTMQVDRAPIGALPAIAVPILLRPGDELVLTSAPVVAQHEPPIVLSCSLPEIFRFLRAGERILFDDGKIGGTIVEHRGHELRVRVESTPPGGGRLLGDKGINFPDSHFALPGLTAQDREDLDFVAAHANVVALSFLDEPADVQDLLDELQRRGAGDLGVVLKIETRRAFEQLPALLLTALQHRRVGVMIARGDLAVEVGYERLAEVQEQILWICEAAHVPVIWATQVLESLAKKGLPSRAEITDAAMGERAECVMLNKGPQILRAVRVLDDILRRMRAHQDKKRSMLRALSIAK